MRAVLGDKEVGPSVSGTAIFADADTMPRLDSEKGTLQGVLLCAPT